MHHVLLVEVVQVDVDPNAVEIKDFRSVVGECRV